MTKMRLLLVAYPGAGKGTQATKLAAHYGIAQLSSGELLRAEVARGTRIGKEAADYLRRGDLVPDQLVFDMLSGPILEAAANGGYVLDGFPRTLRQAEVAYSVAQEIKDIELQAVVYLRVGHDELLKRLRATGTERSVRTTTRTRSPTGSRCSRLRPSHSLTSTPAAGYSLTSMASRRLGPCLMTSLEPWTAFR